MPQMLAVQPVTPKAASKTFSPEKSGTKDRSQFSPHLENALSGKKAQQATVHDKSSKRESLSKDKQEQKSLDANAGDSLTPNQDGAISEITEESPDTTSEETLAGSFSPPTTSDSTQSLTGSTLSTIRRFVAATNLLQAQSAETNNTPKTPREDLGIWQILTDESGDMASFKTQLEQGQQTNTASLILKSSAPVMENKKDALLSQLQQIIDNANETGTVSITTPSNSNSTMTNPIGGSIHGFAAASFSSNSDPITVATTPETSELNLTGLLVGDLDGIEKPASKPMQQLNGTKHDIQQQYFNAKLNVQNLTENQENLGEHQQDDELSQQPTGSSFQTGPFSVAEQANTFSQVSATVQHTQAQPANESVKTIVLPSGMVVHEDEIIQQLTERFQVSSKHMDSRINLKLHPAELGELKINLSVKEGSIRANVVAQSQHTMEILEKNIPKLRTVLENQGFTVDQISVTAESDSVGSFDLFDRQFFNNNDNQPAPAKNHRRDEDAFVLEDNEYLSPATSTGVNVKI